MQDSKKFITFILVIAVWYIGVNLYLKSRFPKQPQQPVQQEKQEPPSGQEEKEAGKPESPQPEKPKPVIEKPAEKTTDSTETLKPAPSEKTPDVPDPEEDVPTEEKTVTLKTGSGPDDGYIITLTNRGAKIESLITKNYFRDKDKQTEKLQLLSSDITRAYSLEINNLSLSREAETGFTTVKVPGLEEKIWNTVSAAPTEAVFETGLTEGIRLRKKIAYNADFNGFNVILSLVNPTGGSVSISFTLTGSSGVIPEYEIEKGTALKAILSMEKDSGKIETEKVTSRNLKDEPFLMDEGTFKWAAGCNKYFAVFLKHEPGEADNPVITASAEKITFPSGPEGKEDFNIITEVAIHSLKAEAGATGETAFSFHAIPIRKDELKQAGIEYREVISLGMIDALGELFLGVLSIIHKVLPNWGLSIIVFTILVNIVMYPLNKKSQISMHKMQKLQPELKKLQKAYKNNKQKLNAEMMKLYHKHGVNPLGGCLPMLLQIPIFIGIFYSLRGSFNLRQSEFLWMHDLSLPDALFSLPFQMFPTFNLLPFIMSIAMVIQQKLSQPKTKAKPDPNKKDDMQQSMQGAMKIMPFIMLFFFYKFPSGLILYWSTNSILRIFETYHIKHRLLAEPAPEKEGGVEES